MGRIKDRVDKEIAVIEKGVEGDDDIRDVAIGLKLGENKVHWHFPADDETGKLLIREAMGLYNINEPSVASSGFAGNERIKMTLHMPLGDRMVFSAALRDFKKAFPETRVKLNIQGGEELWKFNPNVDMSLMEFDREIKPGCQDATNKSNSRDYHYVHAFRESIEQQLGVTIPMGPIKPDIWLSQEEYDAEPLVAGPYWLITAGVNPAWSYKTYPFERWQEFVSKTPDVTFVQIGIGGKIGYSIKEAGKDVKKVYEAPILQGDNVISFVGKTDGKDFRKLFQLFLHCEGSIGLVSSQMHIAAGFDKPCITLAGAREPVWFTRYFGHQYINTEGCLPCSIDKACWKCNENCKYLVTLSDGSVIPRCVDLIKPEHIATHFNYYYDGGRLQRGKKSKIIFKNVNKNLDLKKENVYICDQKNLIDKLPIEAQSAKGIEQRKVECGDDGIKRSNGVVEQCGNELQGREINFLASFSSAGGGEQSAKKMIQVLRNAGCKVNAYSWAEVHKDHLDIGLLGDRNKLIKKIFDDRKCSTHEVAATYTNLMPLIVIGNDQVYEMPKDEIFKEIVHWSSQVILVINWAVGDVPKTDWLLEKLTAVIFHNSEKIEDWKKKQLAVGSRQSTVGSLQLIPFIGAIDIEKFLEYPVPRRGEKEPLVVIKHGVADGRKYVTKESINKGDIRYDWQREIIDELDTVFYQRLLDGLKGHNIEFRFMQAHSELENHFKGHPKFKFYKWNEMPVNQFLSQGHIYLDHYSREWCHQLPRTGLEAMSTGLVSIVPARDGYNDRIKYGQNGFFAIHFNDYKDKLDLMARKESLRYKIGSYAREYAKANFDPKRWVGLVKELIG